MNLTEQAELFARAAHGAIDQRRKYTGGPYIMHPMRVAELVSEGRGTVEMKAAAWLHDVVEDTHITHEQIRRHFGQTVHDYVYALSEDKTAFANRRERKLGTVEKIKTAALEVKIIKTCDIIANAEDLVSNFEMIMEQDGEFVSRWINEQRRLFAVLCQDNIPHLLYARANELLYGSFYENTILCPHSESVSLL